MHVISIVWNVEEQMAAQLEGTIVNTVQQVLRNRGRGGHDVVESFSVKV